MRSALALIAALLVGTASAGDAAPITVPPDLDRGDDYRLLFVTSAFLASGTSPDVADYNAAVDAFANAQPELAALGTTWTAIASTPTVDARDNTNTNPLVEVGVPIYTLNGGLLAFDNADLWDFNHIGARITNESGALWWGDVWTGTSPDGTADTWCETRSLGHPSGHSCLGRSSLTSLWTAFSTTEQTWWMHLYAMSGRLTVVPEPGTGALLALGLVLMRGVRHGAC